MVFVWDPRKEQINIQDHGISFSVAKFAFNDSERWERYDTTHSQNEDRWQTLALVEKVLFIVFTEEKEDVIRIISARIADKNERRIYNGKRDPVNWRKAF